MAVYDYSQPYDSSHMQPQGSAMSLGGLGGLAGGLLGFIGQQQTNQKNWDIVQSANAASAAQAQAQMDFQERMRQTQYQTAIEDMKKAGLNPMLAYSQGGAGVPTGAMGSVSTAKMENALGAGVTGYQQLASNNAELDLKASQTTATSAQAIKTEADTIQTKAQTLKTAEDTNLSIQQKINLQKQIAKLEPACFYLDTLEFAFSPIATDPVVFARFGTFDNALLPIAILVELVVIPPLRMMILFAILALFDDIRFA